MTKLLHPPRGTTHFTFPARPQLPQGHEHLHLPYGCGEEHAYDGEHGIDCGPCVAYVLSQSPEERCVDPALRHPIAVWHEDPAEVQRLRAEAERRRDEASYRIEEVREHPLVAAVAPTGGLTIGNTVAMTSTTGGAATIPQHVGGRGAEVALGDATEVPLSPVDVVLPGLSEAAAEADAEDESFTAYEAGRSAARAGLLRKDNPHDGRSTLGRAWSKGHDAELKARAEAQAE